MTVNGILTSDEATRSLLFEELSWFLSFDFKPGILLFPENHRVNSYLRLLQFRIALQVDPLKAESIAQKWDEELVYYEPREMYLLERFMYVLQLLLSVETPIHPARLIACSKEMDELLQAMPELAERMASFELPPSPNLPVSTTVGDPVKLFFTFTVSRCAGVDFLVELFDALDALPSGFRSRMLTVFNDSASASTMLIDRVWLAESKKETTNWIGCLQVLRSVRLKSAALNIPNIVAASSRAIAIILDEYIESSEEALAELDASEKEYGASPLILDERATILYHKHDYAAALAIWRSHFAEQSPISAEYDISIWSCRKAGISAALSGDWPLAANYFALGHAKAKTTDLPWATVGFLADVGYAHWKSGQHKQLVSTLAHTLQLLETLPDPLKDFNSFSMGKNVGTLILWIKNEVIGARNDNFIEPYPGMCSNPEPNEHLRKLPRTVVEYSWLMLAEIEFDLNTGGEVYDIVSLRCNGCKSATVQIMLHSLRTSFCTRASVFQEVLKHAFLCVRAMTATRAAQGTGKASDMLLFDDIYAGVATSEEVTYLEHMMLTVLICAASRHQCDETLRSFKEAIRLDHRLPLLSPFLASAENILSFSFADARQRMRDNAAGWQAQTLGALCISRSHEATPEDMFQAHVFLLGCIRSNILKREAYICLGELISMNWTHLLQFPVLFRAPFRTITGIARACQTQDTGLRKVAQILLAVTPAISVPVPTSVINDLEQLYKPNNAG